MDERNTGDTGNGPQQPVGRLGGTARTMASRVGIGAVATVVLAGVMAGGLTAAGALGGVFEESSSTSTVPGSASTTVATSTTTTEPPGAPTTTVTVPLVTRTIDVPGVGQVVVTDGPTPTVVSVTALPGFTVVPDDDPNEPSEIHLRFLDAVGGRIDVQAEFEDGALRIRVRDRRLERGTGGSAGESDVDDRSGDDHRGRGRGGDVSVPPVAGGSAGTPAERSPGGGSGSTDGSDDRGRGRSGDDRSSDDRSSNDRGRGRSGDDGSSDNRSSDDGSSNDGSSNDHSSNDHSSNDHSSKDRGDDD